MVHTRASQRQSAANRRRKNFVGLVTAGAKRVCWSQKAFDPRDARSASILQAAPSRLCTTETEPRFEIDVECHTDGGRVHYIVELKLLIGSHTKLCMEPEDPSIISGVDVDAPRGSLGSSPGNGEFSVSWDEKKIDLCVGSSGTGKGGVINLRIETTPTLLASLRAALKVWKNCVAE